MEFLVALAFGVGSICFQLVTCILIEHVGPVERYSLKQRVPGMAMNIVGTMLTIFMMYPIAKFWDALGIAPAITLPLWAYLEPLGSAGYVLQCLLLICVAGPNVPFP